MDIEQTIRDYLPQLVHLSLGTCKDGKPWVCEVHFVHDDELNLYFRSLSSRRHSQDITANPNVAGNIVKQHLLGQMPLGLYFEGTAEKMDDEAARQKVFPYFQGQLERTEDILEEAKDPNGHQFYKITIETWYVFGKIGDSPVQKHELPWHGGKK